MQKSKQREKTKEMLVLWCFKWFHHMQRGKIKKIKFDWEKEKHDLYFQYAREMIRQKFINKAHFFYIDSAVKTNLKEVYPNIFIHIFSSINTCLKKMKRYYKFVFIRGDFDEYNTILNKISRDVTLFYASDIQFMPQWISIDKIDIFLINEKKQLTRGEKKYPDKEWVLFNKTADTSIFYSAEDEKKYDICYPADFWPWKNHELLFTSIGRLPNSKKISCICPGETFGHNDQIGVWATKNHFKLFLPGRLSREDLAKVMRRSKIGVIPGEKEANPRIITEMLSCGLPILANKYLKNGLRFINSQTGIKASLDDFPKSLNYLLKNYKKYHPSRYFKKYLAPEKVTKSCLIQPCKKILKKKKLPL